jgi:hypothetical protein
MFVTNMCLLVTALPTVSVAQVRYKNVTQLITYRLTQRL